MPAFATLSVSQDARDAAAGPGSSGQRPLLVRQPIVDHGDAVIGYELRLEGGAPSGLDPDDEDVERERQLLQLLDRPEFAQLSAQKLTTVALSPGGFHYEAVERLPRDLLISVPVPRPLSDAYVAELQALLGRGHRIALDYDASVLDGDAMDQVVADDRALLGMTRMVRLDVERSNAIELSQAVRYFAAFGGVQMTACNLSCREEFDACRAMPFEHLHGRYFMLHSYGRELEVDHTRSAVIELLNRTRSGADVAQLEAIFKRDPLLTYRLLRYINSPGCGMLREIRSIGHGLVALGYDQLYRWLTLLLLSRASHGRGGGAFFTNALTRGRLMELLGQERLPRPTRDGLFIAGVFSLLDALLGVPLAQALAEIHLSPDVEAALLHNQGPLAPYVSLALACEQGWQEQVEALAGQCGLDVDEVNIAHVYALVWAESIAQ